MNSFDRQRAIQHAIPVHSPETARLLSLCMGVICPRLSIEVGTAIGLWTLHLASEAEQRDGLVYSFEVSAPTYQVATRHCTPYTNSFLYRCKVDQLSLERLWSLLPWLVQFAFVDGEKWSYDQYFQLLTGAVDTELSCIVFDDVLRYKHKTAPLFDALTFAWRHWTIYATEHDDWCCIASPQQHTVAQCQTVLQEAWFLQDTR